MHLSKTKVSVSAGRPVQLNYIQLLTVSISTTGVRIKLNLAFYRPRDLVNRSKLFYFDDYV